MPLPGGVPSGGAGPDSALAGDGLMQIPALRADWRVLLVVTPENAAELAATVASLRENSLGTRIQVLTSESLAGSAALADTGLPVAAHLPERLDRAHYWTGIARCIPPEPGPAIALLAGCRVPPHWDARLVAAGQLHESAALAPLCARHPFLTIFRDPDHNPGLTAGELDQWLNDYSDGAAFPVPLLSPSCLLMQGEFREACAAADVDDDARLVDELRRRGAGPLATSRLYVDDSRCRYECPVQHLPGALREALEDRSPLTGMRHALSELSGRREKPPVTVDCRPVQLHVGHSWGGGLGRWMQDFVAADTAHRHLVLRSIGDLSAFGQTIALYRSTAMDVPLRTWTLAEPVVSVSPGHYEYRRILDELVADYGVESLLVSSLIGHSLDLLRTPLPTTLVMHDFFPFCPALYATFGSPCHRCTAVDLRRCNADNPRNDYFRHETDDHWLCVRREFGALLQRPGRALVAPSRSVVDRYRQLEPRLRDVPVRVIPHGLGDELAASLQRVAQARPAEGRGRLRVVVPGRLSSEKGGDLMAALCEPLSRFADIYLLGGGDSAARFRGVPGVHIVQSYALGELAGLLGGIQADLGLLLSTVPETYSYTLSELWAAGIPVVATRLGALEERIDGSGAGWLVEPDAAAVLAQLEALDAGRGALQRARESLAHRAARPASAMAREYAEVEPQLGFIPLCRYALPRRSWDNPYRAGGGPAGEPALHINPAQPYRRAFAEFVRYTDRKIRQSPALRPWSRRLLGACLRPLAVIADRRASGDDSDGAA